MAHQAHYRIFERSSFTSTTTKTTHQPQRGHDYQPQPQQDDEDDVVNVDDDLDDVASEDDFGKRRAVSPPPSYITDERTIRTKHFSHPKEFENFDPQPTLSRSATPILSRRTPRASSRPASPGPPGPHPQQQYGTLKTVGSQQQIPAAMSTATLTRRYSAPSVYDDSPPMAGCTRGGKTLLILANMVILIASIVLVGTGAGLMGFYRIHMLDVVTLDFLIVPLLMIVGGVCSLFTAIFGFYATMRDESCLMITYSVFLALQFLTLLAAIISTVRLLFEIQTGLYDVDVIPELNRYESDPWVRYKWDTLQREYSCCGGYLFTSGYLDWKHTVMGGARNSVPDSCCLTETPMCGKQIFAVSDLRIVAGKIHTHGCLTTMMRRLETHVTTILLVFAIGGGLLCMLELLSIVLACCMASAQAHAERELDWEYNQDYPQPVLVEDPQPVQQQQQQQQPRQRQRSGGSRPVTPQTILSNDLTSHHETAF